MPPFTGRAHTIEKRWSRCFSFWFKPSGASLGRWPHASAWRGAGDLRPTPPDGSGAAPVPLAPAPYGFGALRYAPPLGPLRSLGAARPPGGVPGSLRAAVGGGPRVGPLAPLGLRRPGVARRLGAAAPRSWGLWG